MDSLDRCGAASGVDASVSGRRCRDGLVAIRRRQGREAAAELVGTVPSQLALVTFFELLLAAASLTVLLDARIEDLDFDRMSLRKWLGRGVDQLKEACSEPNRDGTGAIELFGRFDEGPPTVRQVKVGRQDAGAVEVAQSSLRRNHCTRWIDALGQEARRDHVGADCPKVDACTSRRDSDQIVRHEVGENDKGR